MPGHEIVGLVDRTGTGVPPALLGRRMGVAWLGHTCGHCLHCRAGRENLCDTPVFTGHGRDGGFATHVVAEAAYCVPIDLPLDPDHAETQQQLMEKYRRLVGLEPVGS